MSVYTRSFRSWWYSEYFCGCNLWRSRSHWRRGLRRRSAAARQLRLWFRIPSGAWMSVCCKCCVLSGRGTCVGLITSPEESYRLWCVVVCDLETLWMRRPWPTGDCRAERKKISGRSLMAFSILVASGSRSRLSFHMQEMTDVKRYEFCAHCT